MFPLLELQSEGIHGGMMVSKRQCHPKGRSEVVAKIHVLGSTHGVKVTTNASPAIPSKKKKVLYSPG